MRNLALISVVVLIAIAVLALPSAAADHQVRLKNGTVIMTRYAPIEAPFDSSLLQFLTGYGNWTVVAKDSVEKVVSLTEALGQGIYIDDKTIMIGQLPNDRLSPEEEAELAAQDALNPALPNVNLPTFSEPNEGGGIPLNFLSLTTPPIGNSGDGGFADDRRFGDGPSIQEPLSRE